MNIKVVLMKTVMMSDMGLMMMTTMVVMILHDGDTKHNGDER